MMMKGSCWFLENGKCRIYEHRFTICRIYPYMLHREADEKGSVDWRQFCGLDQHGEYNAIIPDDVRASISPVKPKSTKMPFLPRRSGSWNL